MPEMPESGWGSQICRGIGTKADGRTDPIRRCRRVSVGLFGMTANVQEWVRDWYAPDLYEGSPQNDSRGPERSSHEVTGVGRGSHPLDNAAEVCSGPLAKSTRVDHRTGQAAIACSGRRERTSVF